MTRRASDSGVIVATPSAIVASHTTYTQLIPTHNLPVLDAASETQETGRKIGGYMAQFLHLSLLRSRDAVM